ncbi:MAG: PEP-CTERM sorting domain-containing protein [Akkermansiaceae bacterium]|jgi:hypothetical protein
MTRSHIPFLVLGAILPASTYGALVSTWTAPQDAGSLGDAGAASVLLAGDPAVGAPLNFTSSVSSGTNYTDVIVLSGAQQSQLASAGLGVTLGLDNVRGATRKLVGASFESLGNLGSGANVSARDATIDLFLSPDNLNDVSQLIFETGGNGAGSSLNMNGSIMTFASATNAATAVNTTVDLTSIYGGAPDTDNMLQVRLAFDLGNDLISLSAYNLATGLRVTNSTAFAGNDWAGGDGNGFFNVNGTTGGSANNNVPANYSNFDGQFGGLKFYTNEVLEPIPEPSSLLLLGLGACSLLRRRR